MLYTALKTIKVMGLLYYQNILCMLKDLTVVNLPHLQLYWYDPIDLGYLPENRVNLLFAIYLLDIYWVRKNSL